MSTTPVVSVVIPTYNRARVLGNAIESVLTQDYHPLEVIVVDDGSSDASEEVVRAFAPRVRYARQANCGPSAARNHGVRISHGEILMFLDSDDLWLPGKVSRQMSLFEAAGPSVCCAITNAILREDDGQNRLSFEVARLAPRQPEGLWTNPAEVLSTRFLFFNQVIGVRREAFLAAGGFDESMRVLEDWDLALRLSFLSPWAYTSQPLAMWNPESEGSLAAMAKKNIVGLKRAAAHFQERAMNIAHASPGVAPAVERLLRAKLAKTRRELRAHQLAESASSAARAAGEALLLWNRAESAMSRHLPHYPEMCVQPLPVAEPLCEMQVGGAR